MDHIESIMDIASERHAHLLIAARMQSVAKTAYIRGTRSSELVESTSEFAKANVAALIAANELAIAALFTTPDRGRRWTRAENEAGGVDG